LALQEISRRKPVLKKRVERARRAGRDGVRDRATSFWPSAHLKLTDETCNLHLTKAPGRCIHLRHGVERFKKRLKAPEAKTVQETWCLLRNNYERWRRRSICETQNAPLLVAFSYERCVEDAWIT